MTAIPRRLCIFLLHLALLIALWTTALGRVSERPTALRLLTGVGTHVLNPVLTAGGNGVGPAAYDALQQLAKAKPDDQLPLPGIKAPIYGRDIAGQSFDQGTRTIYTKVAAAYYDGGQSAALALPPDLTNVLFDYRALTQFSKDHGTPVTLPQIPTGLLDLLSHTGLSASTFTQAGHDGTVRVATFAWIASLLLGLLVFFLSRGGRRIFSVSNAFSNAALPGLILLAILWFIVGRDPTRFPAINGLSDIVFGAFMPVYLGAFLAGLAGQVGAGVLKLTYHPTPHAGGPRPPREPEPVPVRSYAPPRPAPTVQSNLPEAPYPGSQGYGQRQQYPGNDPQPPRYGGSQSAYPGYGQRPQSPYPGAGSQLGGYPGSAYPPSSSLFPGPDQQSGYPGSAPQQPYPGYGQQGQPRSPYPGGGQRPYPRDPYGDPGPGDPDGETQPF